MSVDNKERALLFGLIAVKSRAIELEDLLKTTQQWIHQSDQPLDEVLVKNGLMSDTQRDQVTALCATAAQGTEQHSATIAHDPPSLPDHSTDVDYEASIAETLDVAAETGELKSNAVPVDRTDRYRRTKMHAQGGIGRVWLVHDRILERDVALKELRPDREQVSALTDRFISEARITGRLQHPGIVPVYELAAEGDSRKPFYTMRFFHGKTLFEAVSAYHRQDPSDRSKQLKLRELIQAFLSVIHAVAYANSRGVVHRDLKGHNVVLGDFGEVIVLDWGLAKLVDDSADRNSTATGNAAEMASEGSHSIDGQVIGTPAYMAPEQADGRLADIDRRTDVYGLGAILYHILTNKAPFSGQGPELLRQVSTDLPVSPREHVQTVPLALQAVCLTALNKSPDDRYSDAGAMADDIQRFLADEPVSVYREPFSARCGRWARRHKTAVAAALVLLITAVAALSTSTFLIAREQGRTETQRQLAVKNASRATLQKGIAETAEQSAAASFDKAVEAVDTMLTKVADRRLRHIPHMSTIRRDLLEEAVRFNRELLAEHADDAKGQAASANAYARLGKLYRDMGELDQSMEAHQQAADCVREMISQAPTARLQLGKTMLAIADLQTDQSDYDASAQTCREVIESLNDYDASQTSDPKWVMTMASAYHSMSTAQMDAKLVKEAETNVRKAIDLLQSLPADEGAKPEALTLSGKFLYGLAIMLERTGRADEAEPIFEQALNAYDSLHSADPDEAYHRWMKASIHRAIAGLMSAKGAGVEAERHYKEALELRNLLAENFPQMPEYRLEYARTLDDIAIQNARAGEMEKAESYFRQALEEDKEVLADFPKFEVARQSLGYDYSNLATMLLQTGRTDEAAETNRLGLETRKVLADSQPGNPDYQLEVAFSHNNLGVVEQRLGHNETAETNYREAIRIQQKLVASHPTVTSYQHRLAGTHRVYGSLLTNLERYDEALQQLTSAQTVYGQIPATALGYAQSQWYLAETHQWIAGLYSKQDQTDNATASYRKALAIRGEILPNHPQRIDWRIDTAVSHRLLGIHLLKSESLEDAETALQRSVEILAPLAEQFDGDPRINDEWARGIRAQAELGFQRNDMAKADEHIQLAIQRSQTALTKAPDNEEYLNSLYAHRYWEARIRIANDRRPEAVAIADQLTADSPRFGEAYYEAARIHALALADSNNDDELSAEQKTNADAQHFSLIVKLLRQALKFGVDRELSETEEFQPLLERAEMKELTKLQ